MGKSKNKKKAKAPASSPGGSAGPPSLEQQPRSHANEAIDGHNVDGWTSSQIKAYNELLIERQKLEKQRLELEQRSLKSQAGRALLNDKASNIDSAFKQQSSAGDYRFTGSGSCCVEIDSQTECHHEICQRSKTTGISWTEVDTIKYYYLRINQEKSDRIRNALRKQRDLELIKIKKEDEEGKTKLAKKTASRSSGVFGELSKLATSSSTGLENELLSGATKETQRLVTNILEQLDHLRTELQNGQISSLDMQKKLDNIEVEMQAAQLKTSNFKSPASPIMSQISKELTTANEAFQQHVKERLLSDTSDTYSKAFHIMEHFLSASKPGDFQIAVAELKDVLRLNGPMCEELQKSFDALEGIFDNPDKLSFTGPDGKQECTSIIDLMEKMKETLQKNGSLPEGANAELTKVFQECIDLEAEARSQMQSKCEEHLQQNNAHDLAPALIEIRTSIVAKSPIPPLTEKTLEDEIRNTLDTCDAKRLIAQGTGNIKEAAVEGLITSIVLNRAQKHPNRYVETIGRLSSAYIRVKGEQRYLPIENAFPKVEEKMRIFAQKFLDKKAAEQKLSEEEAFDKEASPPLITPQKAAALDDETDPLSNFPSNTKEVVSEAIKQLGGRDHRPNANVALRKLINDCGQSGLWPVWLIFSEDTNFAEDTALQSKSREFEDNAARIMAAHDGGLQKSIIYLYQAGVCPGMCAAIISEILAGISEEEPALAQKHIRDLSNCLEGLLEPVSITWGYVFRHLSLAMIQLYTAMYLNASTLFPDIPPVHFALSSMAMTTTYVCLMRSSETALSNFRLLCVFINACLSSDGFEPVQDVVDASRLYDAFCRQDEYRCLTIEPCSMHFAGTHNSQDGVEILGSDDLDDNQHSHSQSGKTARRNSQQAATAPAETKIHYRKTSNRTSYSNVAKRKAARMDALQKAVTLYGATAKKAARLMRVKSEEWEDYDSESSGLMSPSKSKTMTSSRSASFADPAPPFCHEAQPQSASRFSEDIDERRRIALTNVASSQHVQTLFRAIETGEADSTIPKQLAQDLKDQVMSGNVSNPAWSYKQCIDSCAKSGTMPTSVKVCMNEALEEIKATMKDPEKHANWVTCRMKYILTSVQAKAPSRLAFYDMAYENPLGFEQYAAMLTAEQARLGKPTDAIRQLFGAVYDKVSYGELHRKSKCLQKFFAYAREDWQERDQSLSPNENDDEGSESDEGMYAEIEDTNEQLQGLRPDILDQRSGLVSPSPYSKIAGHALSLDTATNKVTTPAGSDIGTTGIITQDNLQIRGTGARDFDASRFDDLPALVNRDPVFDRYLNKQHSAISAHQSKSKTKSNTDIDFIMDTYRREREQEMIDRLSKFTFSLKKVEETRRNILNLTDGQKRQHRRLHHKTSSTATMPSAKDQERYAEVKYLDGIVARLKEQRQAALSMMVLISEANGLNTQRIHDAIDKDNGVINDDQTNGMSFSSATRRRR